MKICEFCNTNKIASGFYTHAKYCKDCVNLKKRKDYHSDKDNARLEGRINWYNGAMKRFYDRFPIQ
jgi:hypothetical protein